VFLALSLGAAVSATGVTGQNRSSELDATVQSFLDKHRGTWRDLNVPESDGKLLHDLIVKHRFTRALEIGTSTGHSGVWIAWALAKTGGKLITVEIDPQRHRTALANFKESGLAAHIDSRRCPVRSTSCSRTLTRTGTRTISSRCGRRWWLAAASRRTTCRGEAFAPVFVTSLPTSRHCRTRRRRSTPPAAPACPSRANARIEASSAVFHIGCVGFIACFGVAVLLPTLYQSLEREPASP
jgi:hypothetical protein